MNLAKHGRMTRNEKIALGVGVAGVAVVLAIVLWPKKANAAASQTATVKAGHTYKLSSATSGETSIGGDQAAVQEALDFAVPETFQVTEVATTQDGVGISITAKALKDASIAIGPGTELGRMTISEVA